MQETLWCSCVCTDTCSTRNFFCFDIGIPYLIHGCITMRRCVSYNYDSRMTFILDFKVKFEHARNFHLLWHWNNMFGPQLFMAYHIWGMVLSPWENVLHTSKIPIQRLHLNIYMFGIFVPLANFSHNGDNSITGESLQILTYGHWAVRVL